jgi:hypothetical protein
MRRGPKTGLWKHQIFLNGQRKRRSQEEKSGKPLKRNFTSNFTWDQKGRENKA